MEATTMKKRTHNVWFTLNANYDIAPHSHPAQLLDDASLLLDGAHGITQSLSQLLGDNTDIHPNDLANALWAAGILIQMAQNNTQAARTQPRLE